VGRFGSCINCTAHEKSKMAKLSIVSLLVIMFVTVCFCLANKDKEDSFSLKQKIEDNMKIRRRTKNPTMYAPTASPTTIGLSTLAPFTQPILLSSCEKPCLEISGGSCWCP
jgi:hypothetical protein